jgi:hypothetical protein
MNEKHIAMIMDNLNKVNVKITAVNECLVPNLKVYSFTPQQLQEYTNLVIADSVTEIQQLRAKVDELQKDANRYRWLREQNADLTNDAFLVLSHDQECGYCNGAWVGSDLDGAIDEAIDKAKDTV